MSGLNFARMAQSRPKPEPNPKPAKGRPAGRRQENKERTRRAILKAALELFSEKGFHRTRTRDISAKAKIAEGTLFNYFPTKEDLALYFLEREIAELEAWFGAQESLRQAPLPERLFAIVLRWFDRLAPYEEFIGAVFLKTLQPGSKLNPLGIERQAVNVQYLRFLRTLFQEAQERGEIPALGDLGVYGFVLFQAGMMVHWLHDRSPGKESSLALLDRSLGLLGRLGGKGGWTW